MKLNKRIKVTVTRTDVKKSDGYISNTHCYLGMALRKNKFDNFMVGGQTVSFHIGSDHYVEYQINTRAVSALNNINHTTRSLSKSIPVTLTRI